MCLWHDKCSEPHLNVRLSLSKSARHSSWWLLHPWSWSSPLFAAAPSDYSYTQVWRSLIFLTGCQHQNHQERRLSWHFHTQIRVTNCSLALLTPLLCICPDVIFSTPLNQRPGSQWSAVANRVPSFIISIPRVKIDHCTIMDEDCLSVHIPAPWHHWARYCLGIIIPNISTVPASIHYVLIFL